MEEDDSSGVEQDHEQIRSAGRQVLASNLQQRTGAVRRRLALIAGIVLAASVFAGILAIAYLVEKAATSAADLGNRRQKAMESAHSDDE